METYHQHCQLCRLVHDGEILTKLHFENEEFIVVDCLVCRVPMAVAKSHRPLFTTDESEAVRSILKSILDGLVEDREDDRLTFMTLDELRIHNLFPDWSYNGAIQWVIDWEQRQIPDHPHCHLRPFPFPETDQWERIEPAVVPTAAK